MNIEQWLDGRTPAPPERLSARMREVLALRLTADAAETPAGCVDAACALLRGLVATPDAGREAALDLLTVDALVTYACEAAADDPDRLTALAHDSIRRIARLAAAPR